VCYRPAALTSLTSLTLLTLLAASPGQARSTRLPIKGFRAAEVVAPSAAAGARPVVVALHGNFDRPEWNCEVLPALVQGRAWILCIRGIPRRDTPKSWDRWTYPARSRVLREVDAALAALKARYTDRVDTSTPLLTGISLGAIYAARFAVATPRRFPRLYLVEGAHKVWTYKAMRRFAKRGGQAVVFGCGRKGCGAQSRRICRGLTGLGAACSEVTVPGLGHTYTEPLPTRARPLFLQMMAADQRWGVGSREGGEAKRSVPATTGSVAAPKKAGQP
jgi:pimeloyl-ACP methyl ester carboxylesterase